MQSANLLASVRTGLSSLVIMLALGGSQLAQAQAHSTASKSADISVFGGYTSANPDYGPKNNNGYVFGADYTRYFGWWVAPALEIRYEHNSGETVRNSTFLGGLRLQGDLPRFRVHPYADLLIGNNTITFVTPVYANYTHDNALTWSIGGGVDVDIYRTFQAKFDYQHESANYGNNGGTTDFTLTPSKLTIGVVYRIPFKSFPR